MALRPFSAGGLAAVLAGGLLASGCTPDPGSTPPPMMSPTPSVTASPTPTRSETTQEREQRIAFEAAEKAYRSAFSEVNDLSLKGGVSRPSDQLRRSATGKYLAAQMDQLRWLKDNKTRVSSAGSIAWVKREAYSSNELTLEACEDFRSVLLVRSGGQTESPEGVGTRVYQQRLTVDRVQGLWKVSELDTQEQLESCDS